MVYVFPRITRQLKVKNENNTSLKSSIVTAKNDVGKINK